MLSHHKIQYILYIYIYICYIILSIINILLYICLLYQIIINTQIQKLDYICFTYIVFFFFYRIIYTFFFFFIYIQYLHSREGVPPETSGVVYIQHSDDAQNCNFHCVSHFAAAFIAMGAKTSIVETATFPINENQ